MICRLSLMIAGTFVTLAGTLPAQSVDVAGTSASAIGHTVSNSAMSLIEAPNEKEFSSLAARMDRMEAENRLLRAQLSDVIGVSNGAVTTASFCEGCDSRSCGCGGCGVCGTCQCNDNCSWIDQLSDSCKEKLSWNKAGGWRIVPFGQLRAESIYSQTEPIADAVIFYLAPNSLGISNDQFTVHGKTSQLNFLIGGPKVGNWQTGGLIIMNFLGQQPLRNQSGPNVINAYGEIKNDRWRFAFGRMLDLFGPITPTTVNGGQQRAAGNIGIFRGAFHIDRFMDLNESTQITMSGRLSQNTTNDFLLIPSARGTDNGFPNLEGRIAVALGQLSHGKRPLEIGFSGVWGETRAFDPARFTLDGAGEIVILPSASNVSTTAGGAIDYQLLGDRFGIRGELWAAQAAGTYAVAVLQTLNPSTGSGIRSVGGWSEIYFRASDTTTVYFGYGIDDPRNQDVGFYTDPVDVNDPGQRTRNQVGWVNAQVNATQNLGFGFEVSYRSTDYINPIFDASGMVYHFASTLKY